MNGIKWIPISERLPEVVEWYLTTVKWGNTQRVTILWFDGLSFKFNAEVAAWMMPLPKPYKAESEE